MASADPGNGRPSAKKAVAVTADATAESDSRAALKAYLLMAAIPVIALVIGLLIVLL